MSRCCSLVLACLIAGCGSQGAGDPKSGPAATPAVAQTDAPAPVAAPVVAAPAPASADGEVGVEVCDAYLDVYRGCIPSLRAEDRPHHDKVVEQLVVAWKQARADAKVADTLVDTCTSARAASKVTLPDCAGW